jgi:hypothetical protein
MLGSVELLSVGVDLCSVKVDIEFYVSSESSLNISNYRNFTVLKSKFEVPKCKFKVVNMPYFTSSRIPQMLYFASSCMGK